MIHINLYMIFYTHVEHGPTKTIYIKYYTEKQTNKHTHDSRTHTMSMTVVENWELILVGLKILWEEEGFQVLSSDNHKFLMCLTLQSQAKRPSQAQTERADNLTNEHNNKEREREREKIQQI